MTKHIPPFVQDEIKKMLESDPDLKPDVLQKVLEQKYQINFSEGQLKKFFKKADEPAPESSKEDVKSPAVEARPYDDILLALHKRTAGKIPKTLPGFKAEFPTSFKLGDLYVSSTLGPVIYRGEQSIQISGYGESKVKSFETVFADKTGKQKQSITAIKQSVIREPLSAGQIDTYLAFLLNQDVEKPKDIPRDAKSIVDHFKKVSGGGDMTDIVKKLTYVCAKNRSEDKSPAQFEYQFREKVLNTLASEFAAIHGYDRDLCRQMLDQETRLPAGRSFSRMQSRVIAETGATNVISLVPRPR